MSALRCFAAIPPDAASVGALARAGATIREAVPAWRDEKWVAEQSLHLTLKFFGSLAEQDAYALCERLGPIVAGFSAFELPSDRVRAIPDTRRCRMLWAAFRDPDGACSRLTEAIEAVATEFGVLPETRPFLPHITLCRARKPSPAPQNALDTASEVLVTRLGSMSVPCVSVFSSQLTPRGPIYRTLTTWDLAEE